MPIDLAAFLARLLARPGRAAPGLASDEPGPAASAEIVRVLPAPSSGGAQRRVAIVRRPDGRFGFVEQVMSPDDLDWRSPLRPEATICDSVETAEREAGAAFPWLRPAPGDASDDASG